MQEEEEKEEEEEEGEYYRELIYLHIRMVNMESMKHIYK